MMPYDEMDLVIKLEKDSLVVSNIVTKFHKYWTLRSDTVKNGVFS